MDDQGRKKAEDDAYTDAVAERLPPALIVSGASILSGEGSDGREHGRGDEEEEADDLLHDADCGGDFDAAAVCDGGDDEKGDLDEPVLTGDGKTYGKERLHAEGIEGEGLLREGKAKVGAGEVQEAEEDGDGLGKNGGCGCSGGPHRHGADEDIVKQEIDETGESDKVHRRPCIAKPAEDAGKDIIGDDEGDACKADEKVRPCILPCFRRGLQPREDRIDRKEEEHGADEAEEGKEQHRASDAAGGFLPISAAHRAADGDGRPHGEPDDDDGQHVHQLASDGDGRDRCGAIEETCDEEVGHAVERLQKTGEKVRDGESHHFGEQRPLGKIDSGHRILFVQ